MKTDDEYYVLRLHRLVSQITTLSSFGGAGGGAAVIHNLTQQQGVDGKTEAKPGEQHGIRPRQVYRGEDFDGVTRGGHRRRGDAPLPAHAQGRLYCILVFVFSSYSYHTRQHISTSRARYFGIELALWDKNCVNFLRSLRVAGVEDSFVHRDDEHEPTTNDVFFLSLVRVFG